MSMTDPVFLMGALLGLGVGVAATALYFLDSLTLARRSIDHASESVQMAQEVIDEQGELIRELTKLGRASHG